MNKKLFKGVWTKEEYLKVRRSMVERGHWHNHPPAKQPREDCVKCKVVTVHYLRK